MERLLDGKCEACKADAPLVTAEEKKEIMPQIPGWNIVEIDGIKQLNSFFAFSKLDLLGDFPTSVLRWCRWKASITNLFSLAELKYR